MMLYRIKKINSLIWTSLILCFVFVLAAPSFVLAGEENDFVKAFAQELSNQGVKNTKSGKISVKGAPSFIPLGDSKGAIPPECHPQEFQSLALRQYQNAQQYAKEAKAYFNRCSPYLTSGNVLGVAGLLQFSMLEYDVNQNPLIQKQTLPLSDGNKIEAFIAVKDFVHSRPWVIVKCGVFCDISSSSSSLNFMINFFDQSPFNVIFLSNHTGIHHIQSNRSLRLGGFYEVYDYYDVAQWLKYDSPYKHTVDSIHAAGISLGGSAALGVSHLKSLFHSKDGSPLFNSTTAICPVVNLGPTLGDMYADSNKGKIFTTLTWKYLKDVAPYLKEAKDYLGAPLPPKAEEFPYMLSDIVLRYGALWELAQPPGRSAPIPSNIQDLLNKNHFSQDGSALEIPTLVWASQDDHIVNFSLNTQTLLDRSESSLHQGAFSLEYGDHCAFATAYGYSATTAVLQSFILNNSPQFKSRMIWQNLALPGTLPSFSSRETHLRQWWKAEEGNDNVTLYYETFNPKANWSCLFNKPYKSGPQCKKTYTQVIPLSALAKLGFQTPQTATQAQVLSRQLNVSLRLMQNTTPIDGTNLQPTHLVWRSF